MPDLPRVGEEFAGYRLRAKLGAGGMSVVYQAENWRLGNVVALKVLTPELAGDEAFRTRFLHESEIAAGLNHPHVVPIIDAGSCDGLLYIAMRYVAGTDLRRLIADRGRLEPATAVRLLGQAALALDAAHRRGLVHRDVKPANLLLERTSDDADPDHLYLADFGISQDVAGLAEPAADGRALGTPRYVAPEQVLGLAVGGAADQYSLGCVLYECLTGRGPFAQELAAEVLRAHVQDSPAPATRLRPGLPPAIDAVFARVLAKQPDDRYPTCADFMAAARAALIVLAPMRRAPRDNAGLSAFRSAPTPPRGFPRIPADRDEAARQAAMQAADRADRAPGRPAAVSTDLPVMEWLPVPERRAEPSGAGGADDTLSWSVPLAARGGGCGEPGLLTAPDSPGPSGVPGPRAPGRLAGGWRSPRILWSLVALVIAAGAVSGVLVARSGGTTTVGSQAQTAPVPPASASAAPSSAAASPTAPPSALFSALTATAATYPGDLRISTCAQQAPTLVQCTNPSSAIASVSFETFRSLDTLYLHYQEIVEHLTGKPFTASENNQVCGSLAPAPTGESTWNQTERYLTTYSVAQMESGKVPDDVARGRMFCDATKGGSEYMVWTQNSGDLLGYATGAAPDQQVWNWFTDVHRDISLPAPGK